MPQNKRTKHKRDFQRRGLLIIALAVICLGLALGLIVFMTDSAKDSTSRQAEETQQTNLDSPAVAEAKVVADKYFEAASNCDHETANSYRLTPKKTTQTKEQCLKECPGKLTYKYVKAVLYDDSETDGIASELATFNYLYTCSDKTFPTNINMVRSPEIDGWYVLNTL